MIMARQNLTYLDAVSGRVVDGNTYFDGISFESYGIVVERVHDPIPDMREDLQDRVGHHGSYLNSLTMSPRTITLECRYFGKRWQDFDDMMDELAAWLITDDDRHMVLRTNPNQYYLAHFVSYEEGDREGGKGIGGFTLTFTAPDPLRYGEGRVSIVHGGGSYTTFEIGGTDAADMIIAVNNVSELTITFTPPQANRTMSLFVPKARGDIKVDCVNHVVRGSSEVYGVTLDSEWPSFVPGKWGVKLNNGTATMMWTQRYR